MRVTAWVLASLMANGAIGQEVVRPTSRIRSEWLKEWVSGADSGQINRDASRGGGGTCRAQEMGDPCPRGGVATMGSPVLQKDFGAGNPIDIRNGNKYQQETDMPAAINHPGLELVRHYNSLDHRVETLGRGWRWSYDTRLYKISDTDIQVIQANGNRIRFTRTGSGRFYSEHPGRGHVDRGASGQWRWLWPNQSELRFDQDGRITQIAHPRQGVKLAVYWGRLGEARTPVIREVATLAGDPGVLRFDYQDDQTRPVLKSVMTPSGRFDYGFDRDSLDPRLSVVIRPDGMRRHYHYEQHRQSGHPYALTGISVLSHDGQTKQRTHTWSYDQHGRATSFHGGSASEPMDQVAVLYPRDNNSTASPVIGPRETLMEDARGRPARRAFGAGRRWEWKYDLQGRVLRMRALHGRLATETRIAWHSTRPGVIAHPAETEIRRHDKEGRLRERILTRPKDGSASAWEFKERFEHDREGRRTHHQLPEGGALRYGWETDGRLMKVEWIAADGRRKEVIRTMPAGYRYGNGLYAVGVAGSRGLMDWMLYQPMTRTALLRQQLLLSRDGRIMQEWIAAPPWKDQFAYVYDREARLSSYRHQASQLGIAHGEWLPQTQEWISWRPNGQALASSRDGGPGIRPVQINDASGLPVQVDEMITAYGPLRRLSRVMSARYPDRQVHYGHNAFGEQIWRKDEAGLTHYLYDQHQRVAEASAQGGQWRVTRRYVYAHQVPVAIIEYAEGQTPALLFVHADSVGLPRLVTDRFQRVRWRGRFTPFGRLIEAEGDIDMPLRLPGQVEDPFTGWHDNYQRTYHPRWGHYLEPDPLGPMPGVAPWSYAGHQPRRHADPLGLMLFAFDGTRNHPESMTNVWLMGQAYRDGLVHYISGPGDEQSMTPGDARWDAAIAWSGSQRVGMQWERLLQAVANLPKRSPGIVVDVTGFSRGASLARDFAQRLATHVDGGRFWLNDPRRGVLTACMDLRFMGLFDSVAQFNALGSGNAAFNLSISPKWKWVAHAVAAHEKRWLFPLTSAKGGGHVVERPFVGAHADIGGGYLTARASPGSTPGNLSNVALQWMAWQAQAAGVRLTLPEQARSVDLPIVHDERSAFARQLQNGDRAVLHADGRKWVEYQAQHPDYGQALRAEVAEFIQRTPPSSLGEGGDVAGWVNMEKYAAWLRQRMGFALSQ